MNLSKKQARTIQRGYFRQYLFESFGAWQTKPTARDFSPEELAVFRPLANAIRLAGAPGHDLSIAIAMRQATRAIDQYLAKNVPEGE